LALGKRECPIGSANLKHDHLAFGAEYGNAKNVLRKNKNMKRKTKSEKKREKTKNKTKRNAGR
jgi:hypothetical protein